LKILKIRRDLFEKTTSVLLIYRKEMKWNICTYC
jgi:hypothetical protein